MELKLIKIGNSVGVTLPKEELERRGLAVGQIVPVSIGEDPFWEEVSRFSKEERIQEEIGCELCHDDLSEWAEL